MLDDFRILGWVIGTPSACKKNIESETEKTTTLTKKLFKLAKTSLKKIVLLLHKGVQHRFNFLTRTPPGAYKKV